MHSLKEPRGMNFITMTITNGLGISVRNSGQHPNLKIQYLQLQMKHRNNRQ